MKDTNTNQHPKSHDTTVTSNRHTSDKKIKTTIRVSEGFWREFLEDARSKGLRTCSIIEALGKAYLYGGAMVPGLGKPQTVNLTIKRVINVPEGKREVIESPKKKKPLNRYTPTEGWIHDPELDPGTTIVHQPRQWKGEEKDFRLSKDQTYWFKIG